VLLLLLLLVVVVSTHHTPACTASLLRPRCAGAALCPCSAASRCSCCSAHTARLPLFQWRALLLLPLFPRGTVIIRGGVILFLLLLLLPRSLSCPQQCVAPAWWVAQGPSCRPASCSSCWLWGQLLLLLVLLVVLLPVATGS
jgi:hypothetical protein